MRSHGENTETLEKGIVCVIAGFCIWCLLVFGIYNLDWNRIPDYEKQFLTQSQALRQGTIALPAAFAIAILAGLACRWIGQQWQTQRQRLED